MNCENAIEIKNLCKHYDGFSLDNLSLSVPKGSVMGFVGQNGAGKSTTIKAILNIIKKDSGEIKIFGLDHIKDEEDIKKNIAVVFDEIPFHDTLNANQINSILKHTFNSWDENAFYSYLKKFNLPRKKAIGQFSRGMKMKLQITASLSHNAKLLIMDEPTSGLDPVVRSEILDVFRDFLKSDDHTILLSSHITSDLERIADNIIFIHNGKLLLQGCKDDILYNHGIIKCKREDISKIPEESIVSIRTSDYSFSVMVNNIHNPNYAAFTTDSTSLDEILLYYINKLSKKEWQ